MKILELCKKIGIDNFKDLERFKKENLRTNEKIEDCMVRYLIDLGVDFKIKESK